MDPNQLDLARKMIVIRSFRPVADLRSLGWIDIHSPAQQVGLGSFRFSFQTMVGLVFSLMRV